MPLTSRWWAGLGSGVGSVGQARTRVGPARRPGRTLTGMDLRFTGTAIAWRGPAPYVFVPVADEEADAIAAVASRVTYGWGCIPVTGRIGGTEFTTSLFPRHGGYLVPVKVALQRAEGVEPGDETTVELTIDGV